MRRRLSLFLSLCFGIPFGALGQQFTSEGVLQDAEFLIKKERKHLLPGASRLFETAPIIDFTPASQEPLAYYPPDLFPEFDTLCLPSRILRAKHDIVSKLYNNHVQGGCSNFHTLFFEGFLSMRHCPKFSYGLRIRGFSEKEEVHTKENHTLIQLHGKLFTERLRLGGRINYHGDHYQLHNSKHGEVTQTLHQVALYKTLSNYIRGTFNYQVDASFYYLSDAYRARERQWQFNGGWDYLLSNALILKASTDLYFTKYSDARKIYRNLWRFKPMLLFCLLDKLDVQAGFNLVFQNDVSYGLNFSHMYPVLEVKYLLRKWLQPYLGIGGDIQQNSLQGFLQENPLLASGVDVRHTNQCFLLYGGARGYIIAQMDWHAGFSLGKYQNFHCLLNSAQDPGRFEIRYDPAAMMFNTFGELTCTNRTETLTARLRGDYLHYTLQELPKPWHRPRYQLDLTGTYRLYDKLLLSGTVHWLGGMVAQCVNTKAPVMLDDVVNIDLRIEYLWDLRFSIFFDFQNFLAKKNERYLHHPTRGFHCMLGLSYAW